MSSANTSASTTVTFFGATGGVANAILVHTLKAGYTATALVRTPQKLRDQLTKQGLDSATMNHLTILEGNALDVPAVKRTLSAAPNGLPTHIVTGLGGAPSLHFDICHPLQIARLDNPTICESGAQTVITALREIYAEKPELEASKPLLTFVSTTGISRGPEDVPFAMRFLYHQVLAEPHVDKRKMENLFRGEAEKGKAGVLRNVVGIRPTLLSGGVDYRDATGLAKVRSGTEKKPALGFSIKRADVGHWVFENVISESGRKSELEGEMVSLTT